MKTAHQYFNIQINGRNIQAHSGQTVAAVLVAAGIRTFRLTPDQDARGLFCGMGVCFECLITVDGLSDQRACMTLAQPGMKVFLSIKDRFPHENN